MDLTVASLHRGAAGGRSCRPCPRPCYRYLTITRRLGRDGIPARVRRLPRRPYLGPAHPPPPPPRVAPPRRPPPPRGPLRGDRRLPRGPRFGGRPRGPTGRDAPPRGRAHGGEGLRPPLRPPR